MRHLESAFRVPRRRARLLEAVVPLDQGNEADDRQAEAETAEPDGKGPAERGAALERPPAARAQRDAEQPLSGRRSPCRQQRALDEDPREDDEEAEQVAVDGLDHDRRDQSEDDARGKAEEDDVRHPREVAGPRMPLGGLADSRTRFRRRRRGWPERRSHTGTLRRLREEAGRRRWRRGGGRLVSHGALPGLDCRESNAG